MIKRIHGCAFIRTKTDWCSNKLLCMQYSLGPYSTAAKCLKSLLSLAQTVQHDLCTFRWSFWMMREISRENLFTSMALMKVTASFMLLERRSADNKHVRGYQISQDLKFSLQLMGLFHKVPLWNERSLQNRQRNSNKKHEPNDCGVTWLYSQRHTSKNDDGNIQYTNQMSWALLSA